MRRLSPIIWRAIVCRALPAVLAFCAGPPLSAQEVEIRRWNHLPINENFATINVAHTVGDISVDPRLRLEDVMVELDTWLLGYIRTFELLDKTARVEIRQAWQSGTWDGLVDGVPTMVNREGLSGHNYEVFGESCWGTATCG